MKILYVSQYFIPETGAGAARAVETTRPWSDAGHDVTVLTGYPNYPTGKISPGYFPKMLRGITRETIDGITIVRVPIYPTAYRTFGARLLNYLSFAVMGIVGTLFIKKHDVVVATSPPLFVGLVGYVYSRLKKVPLCFEVRDLWPESLMATTPGSERTLVYKALKALTAFLYARASRISVVTEGFKSDIVSNYGVTTEKISVLFNGADTTLFTPYRTDPAIRKKLGIEGKFVVTYIGTIGLSHGIEDIIHIASLLKNYTDIVLLIIGDGPGKAKALQVKKQQGLHNVIFLDNQDREHVACYINTSDICLVPMIKSDVFKTRIPVKIFEIMACGKPIVAALQGEAAGIIRDNETGLVVEPEDDYQITNAIVDIYKHPALREKLGRNGRDLVENRFNRRKIALDYIDVLNGISNKP